jgi:hypothetical protein
MASKHSEPRDGAAAHVMEPGVHPLVAFPSGLRENPFCDPNVACADSSGAAAALERIS